MSKCLTATLLLLATAAVSAQPSDWPVVVAKGHFAFPLPASMELPDGTFKSVLDEGTEYLIVAGSDFSVMAQPKGHEQTDPVRDAAIIIRVEQGEPGAYAELGADLSMPTEELEQLNDDLYAGMVHEGESRGELSDVEWGGTQILRLEGTEAISFRYIGTVGPDAKRLVVNTYLIQNYDCMYYITLSYLQAEKARWIPAFERAFGGMRFEKRG